MDDAMITFFFVSNFYYDDNFIFIRRCQNFIRCFRDILYTGSCDKYLVSFFQFKSPAMCLSMCSLADIYNLYSFM